MIDALAHGVYHVHFTFNTRLASGDKAGAGGDEWIKSYSQVEFFLSKSCMIPPFAVILQVQRETPSAICSSNTCCHIKDDRDTLQIFHEMPRKASSPMAGLDRKVFRKEPEDYKGLEALKSCFFGVSSHPFDVAFSSQEPASEPMPAPDIYTGATWPSGRSYNGLEEKADFF